MPRARAWVWVDAARILMSGFDVLGEGETPHVVEELEGDLSGLGIGRVSIVAGDAVGGDDGIGGVVAEVDVVEVFADAPGHEPIGEDLAGLFGEFGGVVGLHGPHERGVGGDAVVCASDVVVGDALLIVAVLVVPDEMRGRRGEPADQHEHEHREAEPRHEWKVPELHGAVFPACIASGLTALGY
ncbi:MAG: hypothetical protein KF705_10165 [Phycisphaeraceae bacterium]|nr:hypothetical protein [Phycisphaeraceae bacterium]